METWVGDWIERWARLEPAREALFDADAGRRFTYADLDAGVRRAHAWLIEREVRPGDRVALLAKNRVEHLELFFACARAGAVLVPLNWRLSADELGWIAGNCAPRFALTEADLAPLLASWSGEQLPLTQEGAPWAEFDPAAAPAFGPETRPGDEDPLMLLYTSGTTGRPKGAVLTHRSVFANSVQTCLGWNVSGDDSTLTHTPFFHAGGFHVLTTPLLHRGGRVVLVKAFDAARTLELVDAERLTLLFAVPTMFEWMAREPAFSGTSFESLRFAISGGAPCPDEVHEAFAARGVRFKQGFGLTEAGPNCFAISLAQAARRPGSVGFPLHGVDVRVVDGEGRDRGPEEVGELWIRGPHVCAGYWENPEATAEAFVDGWLRTGDLVRRDAEGFTWIVGRKKEMFISGGENVYPAEVERALLGLDGVQQAAVVGVPDPRWGEVGVAFLVSEEGAALDPDAVRAACKERLAAYKVPKRVVLLEEMPLTPSGKIAKQSLKVRAGEA